MGCDSRYNIATVWSKGGIAPLQLTGTREAKDHPCLLRKNSALLPEMELTDPKVTALQVQNTGLPT